MAREFDVRGFKYRMPICETWDSQESIECTVRELMHDVIRDVSGDFDQLRNGRNLIDTGFPKQWDGFGYRFGFTEDSAVGFVNDTYLPTALLPDGRVLPVYPILRFKAKYADSMSLISWNAQSLVGSYNATTLKYSDIQFTWPGFHPWNKSVIRYRYDEVNDMATESKVLYGDIAALGTHLWNARLMIRYRRPDGLYRFVPNGLFYKRVHINLNRFIALSLYDLPNISNWVEDSYTAISADSSPIATGNAANLIPNMLSTDDLPTYGWIEPNGTYYVGTPGKVELIFCSTLPIPF
jgi:hypothetical protein